MAIELIERDFRSKVCEKIRMTSEGMDRYRVFTPFRFDDGDHLAIVLKREHGQWILSDEGNTFMRLTYEMDEKDFQKGTRANIIAAALASFSVNDREGELVLPVSDDRFGDALYSFVQSLLKIADVTFLSRERVKSTFLEDFKSFLEERIPAVRRTFDWNDPAHDEDAKYVVDCRINQMPDPLLIFALPNDDKVRDAMIVLLQFERWWGKTPKSLAIFEDQQEINRKVLARFSDVCDKQFSSLNANKDRIGKYVDEIIGGNRSSGVSSLPSN